MSERLEIQTIVSLPFEENTYVVWQEGKTQALVFDPGLQPELIVRFLQEQGLEVAAILNTHGHADHIGGNEVLKQVFPRPGNTVLYPGHGPVTTVVHEKHTNPFVGGF